MRRVKWWLRAKGQRIAPRLTLAVLARRSWVHEPEIALLPLLADANSTAIDAGANKGVYLHHLWRSYRRVVAFEPLPELARFLVRAAPRAEVHAIALSDTHGHARLTLPSGFNELGSIEQTEQHPVDGNARIECHDVVTRPLDSFDFDDVGLLKIDVEGHELAVLHGARRLLSSARPAVLVEVEERHKPGSVAAVRQYFRELDYDGFFLDGDRFRPLSEFALERDQSTASVKEQVKIGRYINNFVFLHKSSAHKRAAMINRWLASRHDAQEQGWQGRLSHALALRSVASTIGSRLH